MTYYRRYRPQRLDDLSGQHHIKQNLEQAFNAGRLSHAYLFCGPKGTGKTSTARILAKMVNCEVANSEPQIADSKKTISHKPSAISIPCNKCSTCISITDGSNLDLIEIDAASNRGIDDIRSLRDKIKLAPTQAKKKVYIIDEVHMLTPEAFNALLKTLEEPPNHVLFILATTEPNKLPPTILSRVQRLDFKVATKLELIDTLKRVAKIEKLNVFEEALELIAQKSDGSFRDSLKILDQLSSHKEITTKVVEQTISSSKFEESTSLLEMITQKDSKKALEKISQVLETGVIVKEFIISLMEQLRMMLLLKSEASSPVKDELSTENYERLLSLTDKFSLEEIIQDLDFFQQALEKLKSSTIPALSLEVAVIESCLAKQTANNLPKPSPTTTEEKVVKDNSPDMVKLLDKWSYVLETIKPYNFSLEALLRQAKVLSCQDSSVLLEVPYSFHQRILEAPKSRDLLESVLADVLGKEIKVRVVLGVRPVRVEELANVEVAADDEVIKIAAEIFNSEVN